MRPLIDEFAAPRDSALEAPLFFIARTATVPIPPSHEEKRSNLVAVDDRPRSRYRRVEAVIISDLSDPAHNGSRLGYCEYLREIASAGFFYQHMLTGTKASRGDG
jgi:hypothetical protein